jgi:hypothetical protein
MDKTAFSVPFKAIKDHLAVSHLKQKLTNTSYDVTIVSDDQKSVKAHKLVLSASSPVLKQILLESEDPHPVIYLCGVQQQELELVIQSMYFGVTEVIVHEDHAFRFMDLAKCLQMKGLDFEYFKRNFKDEPVEDFEIKCEVDLILASESVSEPKEDDVLKYFCNVFEFETKNMGSLTKHKQYKHEGVRYSCNQCEYQATTNSALKRHTDFQHEGVLYVCNLFEFETGRQDGLFRHKRSIHEGVKYSCTLCTYKASDKGNLSKHHQYKHEKIKYNCDQCKYKAPTKRGLKLHIKSKHNGKKSAVENKYSCSDCDYYTEYISDLDKHKQEKHVVRSKLNEIYQI